jgi:hypothetical protein
VPIITQFQTGKDLIFAFDNSANHHAKAPDGLCEKSLNLADGGKNVPKLHNSRWNNILFEMQRPDGIQKGIRTILMERGAWVNGILLECKVGPLTGDNKDKCCARKVLSLHEDFKAQRPWLVEVIEDRGLP